MSRFRIMYEKHHVKVVIKGRDHPEEISGDCVVTACTYIREGRLWLLASDYVKTTRLGYTKLGDGIYAKYVVEPLEDSVKILLRDQHHGIRFRNFINKGEVLELYVRVAKTRQTRQVLKRFPRQIAKLLHVEQMRPLYEDPEITAGVGYFLQEVAYAEHEVTNLILELWGRYRIVLECSRCYPPMIMLRRGDMLCLAFPLAKLVLYRVYRMVQKEVKLFQVNALDGRCVVLCLECQK